MLLKPLIHPQYKAYRRRLGIAEDATEREVVIEISKRITHRPGFIYQSDWDQEANPEVNLPGHQRESIRSHHLAIERGERPYGDCDDFTETACEMSYRAGVDARRLMKVIVCDENTLASGAPETVTHIVMGYFEGAIPGGGNVVQLLAAMPDLFTQVLTLGDTWDQALPGSKHRPYMRSGPRWVRHKPLALSSPATGISMYAVKGAETVLRRDGFLAAFGVLAAEGFHFPSMPAALQEAMVQ